MSRIASVFRPGYKALIAYLTVGYPTLETTYEVASVLANNGCDIIDGLIIPDLPPEEGAELEATTKKLNLDLIYLLAPTSTEERIALVAEKSQGFIYLVSLTGVTGTRQTLPPELEDFVTRVRQKAHQPLCVGFGVSNPEQARRVAMIADGVIVGSRLIQLIEQDATLSSLKSFALSLRQALNLI